MKIFLYESLTGGGRLLSPAASPDSSALLAEGWAMICSLAEDFAAIAGCEVSLLSDARWANRIWPRAKRVFVADAQQALTEFVRLAGTCDATVVIAPEIGGELLRHCRLVEGLGGRLLGPSSDLVMLASDKHIAAECMAAAGINTPRGRLLTAADAWPNDLNYPVVLKPCDGAGSYGIRLLDSRPDTNVWPPREGRWRVETYHAGVAVSVAWLCGPAGNIPLAPTLQRLSGDGRFSYQGGRLPIAPAMAERAIELTGRALTALYGLRGYVGFDLVLGANLAGADDVLIEINPRLTTSYVGLRAATRANLAEAMLHVAEGRQTDVQFRSPPLEFDADGTIRWMDQA